jgi:methyl-accepting chemotaxis protein
MKSSQRSIETFRIHLALTTAVVTAGFALVVGTAMFVPLFVQFDRSDLDQSSLAGIADYLIQLHTSYWPVVFGAIVGSIVSGMLLFLRMTAPLKRFVNVFEAVGRGEVPEAVKIRATDYIQAQADALNAMLEALALRATSRARDVSRLEEALDDLEALELEPRAAGVVAEVRGASDGLRKCLAKDG